MGILFRGKLSDSLMQVTNKVKAEVEQIKNSTYLEMTDEDLDQTAETLSNKYRIHDRIEILEPENERVTRGNGIYMVVPFTGDAKLLQVQGRTGFSNVIEADVEGQKILFRLGSTEASPESLNQKETFIKSHDLDMARKITAVVMEDIERYNDAPESGLKAGIKQRLQERRKRVKAAKDLSEGQRVEFNDSSRIS